MTQHAKTIDWSEDRQLQEAKTVVDKLILAAKNTSFYPEHHAVSRKSVSDLYEHLNAYTRNYGALVLEMGKGDILFQGQKIYQNPDLQNNPAYLCFRDGLKWISFSEGIAQAEILSFLNILKHHRVLEEESKGDIVTSLWEAGLHHIKYSTTNVLWQNEPLLDLASLEVAAGRAEPRPEQPAEEDEGDAPSIADTLDQGQVFALSPEEIDETRRMVEAEEARDFDQDVFDVLLVILKEQRESEDFATVLDIIKDTFKHTLAQGDFQYAAKFLGQLNDVRKTYKNSGTWALAHIDDFLLMISGPQVLSVLNDALSKIKPDDHQKINALENMLYQLRPESMMSIGQTLQQIKDKTLSAMLLRVLTHHASKDPRPLIHMARQTAPPVQKTAIFAMGHISHPDVLPVITEASRADDSSLRKTAVQALTRKTPPPAEQILPFISDHKKEIRELAFRFLIKLPGQTLEPLILDYLNKTSFTPNQRESLLLLYQVIGNCKGANVSGYLSKQLLGRPWRIGTLRRIHRQGAALALCILNTDEASQAIKTASRSIWPNIRRAVKNAKELSHVAPGTRV